MDVKPRRALAPRNREDSIPAQVKGKSDNMGKEQAVEAAANGPRRGAFQDKSNVTSAVGKDAKEVAGKKGLIKDKKPAISRQPLRPQSSTSIALPAKKPTRGGVQKINVYEDKKRKSPERAAAIANAVARSKEQLAKRPSASRRPVEPSSDDAEPDLPAYSDHPTSSIDYPSKEHDNETESEDESSEDYDENAENREVPTETFTDEEASQDEDEEYATARSRPSDNTTGVTTTFNIPKLSKADEELMERACKEYEGVEDPEESVDIRMVTEYGEEIFEYMRELEIKYAPNPNYMDHQNELQWSMRSILFDWLVQVHQRMDLRPETLFLACNYIDRFLSIQVVSLRKLQLCGITALFIAAKYEEINCPSLQEMCYMVDYGYLPEDILKAERFMLQKLNFALGWPGPMSFLRRISRGDDYDIDTRTLAKYFLEVCLMDERFVGVPPSFVAAVSHCLARIMLNKGNWTLAHVYYSGYTANQMYPSILTLLDCLKNAKKHHGGVKEKYHDKLYWNAAGYVERWVKGKKSIPTPDKL